MQSTDGGECSHYYDESKDYDYDSDEDEIDDIDTLNMELGMKDCNADGDDDCLVVDTTEDANPGKELGIIGNFTTYVAPIPKPCDSCPSNMEENKNVSISVFNKISDTELARRAVTLNIVDFNVSRNQSTYSFICLIIFYFSLFRNYIIATAIVKMVTV